MTVSSEITRADPVAASSASSGEARWRSVALPNEHGGWGLTLEPVLLGLLVATSWPGLMIGVAAFVGFLARTPLRVVLVDRWRHRDLERTRMAARLLGAELAVIAALGVAALVVAGPTWLVPVAMAVPLVIVELAYDMRSRSRRLVPELCGSIGIAAVAPAIVLASGGAERSTIALALGLWLVLSARALASIPFVRAQIVQLRRGVRATGLSDAMQVVALVVAAVAVALDRSLLAGAVAIAVIVALQLGWSRRPSPPARTLGFRQLGLGIALVVITAIGVIAA